MWRLLSFGKRIEKKAEVAKAVVHSSDLAQPGRFRSAQSDSWTAFDSVKGKIIFTARLNGKQVCGLLDTGAELSFIDLKCANDIGARLGARQTAGTALGVVNTHTTNQVRLELNGGISDNVSMISIDLSHISSFLDRRVDFILGGDLFRKWAFEIDFTRSSFRLLPTGYRLPGFTYMPLMVVEGVPYVSLDLRGRKITALVDLGMNGDLNLSPAEWQKSGVAGGRMRVLSV